jgi:transposase
LKQEAVQMLLDGQSAKEVATSLGLTSPGLLYRWKVGLLKGEGPAALTMEVRIRELEEQLRRAERERDILKKALAILSRG